MPRCWNTFSSTRERMTVACTSQPREGGELVHGLFGGGVGDGADGEGDEHLVGVQARVVVAHVLDLQVLYGLDDGRGDEQHVARE